MDSVEDILEFREYLERGNIEGAIRCTDDNNRFSCPSFRHFMNYQEIWGKVIQNDFRKCGKEISDLEALKEYARTKHCFAQKFYFNKYVAPVIYDIEKWRKLGDENRKWIKDWIEINRKVLGIEKVPLPYETNDKLCVNAA